MLVNSLKTISCLNVIASQELFQTLREVTGFVIYGDKVHNRFRLNSVLYLY